MKKLFMALVAIMLISLLSVCAGGGGAVKTYTDPSVPIDVGLDGEFVVALPSNPTTGYSWLESYDEAMLKMVEKSYKQNEASKGLVGAGGTEYFRFKALKVGDTKMTLVYRRPWEQPSPQDKTAVFNVRVK